ncbi:hypothetical protein MRX96_016556 [Rhipicephalus microplus]
MLLTQKKKPGWWPSCVSQGGPAPSVSSSDAESADTVSLTISDIQEPLGTKETADNQDSSPSACLQQCSGSMDIHPLWKMRAPLLRPL